MFGSKEKDSGSSKSLNGGGTSVNMFGAGTIIHGEIQSEGDIRIDGKIVGTITSKSKIVVGTTGVVEGEVFCHSADISGKVTGTLKVKELLFLKGSAIIEGDIAVNKLVVEAGAKFNGTCNMGVQTIGNEEKPRAQLKKEVV